MTTMFTFKLLYREFYEAKHDPNNHLIVTLTPEQAKELRDEITKALRGQSRDKTEEAK